MLNLPPHSKAHRIGLFGGSFNPAHIGHYHVALFALETLQLDYVWWLVSPQNPLKDASVTADYAERLALTKIEAQHPQFIVTDIEKQIGSKNTYQTVKAIKQASEAEFIFIMGADSFANFHLWYRWKYLMRNIPIAVLARPGFVEPAQNSVAAMLFAKNRKESLVRGEKPPGWTYLAMPLRYESSTAIRASRKSVL